MLLFGLWVSWNSFGVTERVVGGSLLLPELGFVEMISGEGLLNAHNLMNL